MNTDVFVLTDKDGRLLHPSIQATVLAKYSRSEKSARETLNEISADEADKFYDKWVIKYGHSSVAELSVLPICFENVSIVASKFIEQFQRAGYSEKSTRYQSFSNNSFVLPPGAPDSMKSFASRLYGAYDSLKEAAYRNAARKSRLDELAPYSAKTKARAFDSLRYLLPAGTATNLAAVMNLRDIRYLVSAARSHSNPEIRAIGEQVFHAASKIAPSLIKDAKPDYSEPKFKTIKSHEFVTGPDVRLVYDDSHSTHMIKAFVQDCYQMSWDTFSSHMRQRNNSNMPSAFKTARIGFEIIMDYGAYRDLQRHRRCEQWAETLTPHIGYVIPDDFKATELEPHYISAMDSVKSYGDDDVTSDPELYQYVVPMGYLHRSMFLMDFKELYYIVELRTRESGHISYRRIAYQMYELAKKSHPELMQWCNAVRPDMIGDHL